MSILVSSKGNWTPGILLSPLCEMGVAVNSAVEKGGGRFLCRQPARPFHHHITAVIGVPYADFSEVLSGAREGPLVLPRRKGGGKVLSNGR